MDLEPLDPIQVHESLSRLPFITCSGVYNMRDLGGYSTSEPSTITRPGFVYRSGEISGITEEGKSELLRLGIRTVYDLRSDTEMLKYNTPIPEVHGIQILHVPVFEKEDYSPEMMAKRYELYASGKTEAFMQLYSQILDHGGPAFGTILRHVRDKSQEPFIFHCTAGKDRTGVMAAILLKLADVPDDVISDDYALTRVGREPARAMVMARLAKEPLFVSNNEAALNMFTCRPETMKAFLALLEDKYGGVAQYVKELAGMTDEDIATIQANLVIPASSS